MIQRVAILGVGLIGGSLGLVWKKTRTDLTLIGYDEPEGSTAASENSCAWVPNR